MSGFAFGIVPHSQDRILRLCSAALAGVLCICRTAAADETRFTWQTEPDLSSQVAFDGVETLTENGTEFQRFRFRCGADLQKCRIEVRIPPSRPLEEFRAVTRVNSTHAGIRLAVRLVLPNQIDPRTGKKLVTLLAGQRSTQSVQWQDLEVRLTSDAVEAELRRVRTEIYPTKIDDRGMYIDGCALLAEFSRGLCVVDAEPVRSGPLVAVLAPDRVPIADRSQPEQRRSRMRVERSQVFVDGEPVYLRLVPDHGESAETLTALGVNAVWLPDYRGTTRANELTVSGLVLAATPPHPRFDPADFSQPVHGLPPLEQISDVVDVWYLGTRVSPDQLDHLRAWAREVRNADRVRCRPLMADVIADEGLASRQIDLVGIGSPALHRNVTLGQFRNQILLRSRASSQLTLPWTWIQAESPASMTAWRASLGLAPLVVEPEQITMQVIAALSAGARGIGFWTTRPVAVGDLNGSEQGLAIALACRQIQLLESWLVRGRVRSHILVDDQLPPEDGFPGGQATWLQAALSSSPLSTNPAIDRILRRSDAAVINSSRGSLILAALWDESSQFVPGHLYAGEARLTVYAGQTGSAARITSTGVYGCPRRETAGGLPLVLDEMDQFATVLITSDPQAMRDLSRRVQQTAPRAAELLFGIARFKLRRVQATCEEINTLASREPPSATFMLQEAHRLLQSTESALKAGQYPVVERRVQACLRTLRAVQNLYWQAAISQLPTPTASPFTIAFSSLPDHWRMLRSIQLKSASDNLLVSGDFENLNLLQEAGWEFPDSEEPGQSARADVRVDRRDSNRFLQLAVWETEKTPPGSLQPLAVVVGPAISTRPGDIIEIRGTVRAGPAIRANEKYPLMIFDSELGPEFAVRPALTSSWRTFRFLRLVTSPEFRISVVLQGAGEVHLDKFVIRTVGRQDGFAKPSREFTSRFRENSELSGTTLVEGAGYVFPVNP